MLLFDKLNYIGVIVKWVKIMSDVDYWFSDTALDRHAQTFSRFDLELLSLKLYLSEAVWG